ncbi:MAG: TIGR01244 family phosphatase [Rhodanobacter sp.]|nr:TIGR01244 family phosphatase [Rhodanobacter sp.]ODT87410.1 MAG: TIGR01244 family protein [Rhodanobacter sp. SCN 67-45]
MQIHPLAGALSVSPQIDVDDIAALAAQGIRGIVNNRPDGEEPGQPDNATLESAARAAGLDWRHIPVTGMPVAPATLREFSAALEELPGPLLAFCRSGTRSSALWALQAPGTADDILATARAAGYDLSMLRPWLR